uniref:HD domain-containing protein n=1 Tax=Eubacterium cellulosolvens TaxID=29322 RepID=UPI0006860961|nr:HD domain-containing protein [[Eubacterium] cellulosolvens]
METKQLVEAARIISKLAHKGQIDKQGFPYYLHPQTVASLVETDEEKITAYLHDTLEDTELRDADLRPVFGDEIMDAVRLLTHDPKDSYMEYVKKICTNRLAAVVKIADLTHNLDENRWNTDDLPDYLRRKRKECYIPAMKLLKESLGWEDGKGIQLHQEEAVAEK